MVECVLEYKWTEQHFLWQEHRRIGIPDRELYLDGLGSFFKRPYQRKGFSLFHFLQVVVVKKSQVGLNYWLVE